MDSPVSNLRTSRLDLQRGLGGFGHIADEEGLDMTAGAVFVPMERSTTST